MIETNLSLNESDISKLKASGFKSSVFFFFVVVVFVCLDENLLKAKQANVIWFIEQVPLETQDSAVTVNPWLSGQHPA